MKKICLFIAIISSTITLQAQDLKRATNYFDNTFYSDAIPLYEELAKNNRSKEVVKNLADSYYNTYQLPKAAKWYSYLTSVYGENLDESYFFKYSQALKSIGKYDDATKVLIDYYTAKEESEKVEKLKLELVYLENVAAIGERFEMKSLALNTPFSEFGAAEIDSNLVYSAAKKNGVSFTKKLYKWNNEGYLDLYSHHLSKLELGDSISIPFSKKVNTKMHEGTYAISQDGKTLYFTRNNYIKGKKHTDAQKVSNLKIYKATLKDGEWNAIEELPFNSDDFSTEHPTLSKDGRMLYFSSDRPGGYGSYDIYQITIAGNGDFGEPENLGATINTERKEQFPFIDKNDNLYFSSNGHPGFGLLDIFVAKKEKASFLKPDNIGKPLNSGFDDFAYNLNSNEKTGYFSSNRPEGKGGDDIYSFTITQPLLIENCKQLITGIITDKTSKLALSGVKLSLVDETDKLISSATTKENGAFEFDVLCESSYSIKAEKSGYEPNSRAIRTNEERNAVKDASMDLFSTAEKEKEEAIALEKKLVEEKEKIEALALQQIEEEKQSKIRLAEQQIVERERQEKQEIAKKAQNEKALAKKIADALAKESALVKEKDRTVIQTEEIHFDYSLWYLRRESRDRIQKVIKVMKDNPGMVVEIGTHTDIRGNDDYNKDLSQKRADSAKEFMVKMGIASDRVIATGYGESQPKVVCATEEACTEEDHEWNRRCEFVVLRWDYKSKTP